MKYRIYVVLDILAGDLAMGIQLHLNDAIALRTFRETIGTPGNPVSKHPRDHALYYVGDLNTQAAEPDDREATSLDAQQTTLIATGEHVLNYLKANQS